MAGPTGKLRDAGTSEKRCIVRHHLGFYQNLLVAGIYSIPRNNIEEADLCNEIFYRSAIERCIEQHPILSTTISSSESETPFFTRVDYLYITNHIQILNSLRFISNDDNAISDDALHQQELLRNAIQYIHNDVECAFTNVSQVPPWRVNILVLPSKDVNHESASHRVWISFSYSHSHADGMSGVAFHRSFLEGLNTSIGPRGTKSNKDNSKSDRVVYITASDTLLPDPIDVPGALPIDWMYLLNPILGTYLPGIITKPLGITVSLSGVTPSTWTGEPTGCNSSTAPKARTGTAIFTINSSTLKSAIVVCRANKSKLTAFLDHAIAYAISQTLQSFDASVPKVKHPKIFTNFAGSMAINLRKALNIPESTFGVMASAAYFKHDICSPSAFSLNDDWWHSVQRETRHLSGRSTTTRNQPIGLLRYVNKFHRWTLNASTGKQRDASWEISNLMSFVPEEVSTERDERVERDQKSVTIERLYFSQAASPTGPVLSFNTVSAAEPDGDGDLVICLTWQVGMLGLDTVVEDLDKQEVEERKFVEHICQGVKEVFDHVVAAE